MHTRPVLVIAATFAGLAIALAAPVSAAPTRSVAPSPSATSAAPSSDGPSSVPSSSAPARPRPVAPTAVPSRTSGGIAVPAGNARVGVATSGASSVEIVVLIASGVALAGGGVVLAARRS